MGQNKKNDLLHYYTPEVLQGRCRAETSSARVQCDRTMRLKTDSNEIHHFVHTTFRVQVIGKAVPRGGGSHDGQRHRVGRAQRQPQLLLGVTGRETRTEDGEVGV